jgi:hypothetical protein
VRNFIARVRQIAKSGISFVISARIEQLGSRCVDLNLILYLTISKKYFGEAQFLLRFEQNNGQFARSSSSVTILTEQRAICTKLKFCYDLNRTTGNLHESTRTFITISS